MSPGPRRRSFRPRGICPGAAARSGSRTPSGAESPDSETTGRSLRGRALRGGTSRRAEGAPPAAAPKPPLPPRRRRSTRERRRRNDSAPALLARPCRRTPRGAPPRRVATSCRPGHRLGTSRCRPRAAGRYRSTHGRVDAPRSSHRPGGDTSSGRHGLRSSRRPRRAHSRSLRCGCSPSAGRKHPRGHETGSGSAPPSQPAKMSRAPEPRVAVLVRGRSFPRRCGSMESVARDRAVSAGARSRRANARLRELTDRAGA